jgi:hypothetical protein
MSGAPDAEPPFGAPRLEQLTALVFEIASQLNIERAQRIALEFALEDAGLLSPGAAEAVAARAEVRARLASALDRAMHSTMRVLTEDDDPRRPLRAQEGAAPDGGD